jgi:hypothetical protein
MTKIRFTTVAGATEEIDAKIPKSLDQRFDFLKSDEQLAAIENSRQAYADAFLRNVLPTPVYRIVAEVKIVGDADESEYALDLVDQTKLNADLVLLQGEAEEV